MATITDRQKDSEIIARLIYMAFVAPERANINIGDVSFVPFAAALELHARTREAENREEESRRSLLRLAEAVGARRPEETVSESDAPPDTPCDGDSCPVTYPDAPPELPDTHTHTHTAGANDGEGRAPGSFVGYGSGEKRDCFARITEYVISHGPGAKREIANAGDSSITLDDVIAMCGSRRVPLSKWRAAAAALDRLEGKDQ